MERPGRVKGPLGRSRSGRGTLGEVRDGLGTLCVVQDGSGGPRGGLGPVGVPSRRSVTGQKPFAKSRTGRGTHEEV